MTTTTTDPDGTDLRYESSQLTGLQRLTQLSYFIIMVIAYIVTYADS